VVLKDRKVMAALAAIALLAPAWQACAALGASQADDPAARSREMYGNSTYGFGTGRDEPPGGEAPEPGRLTEKQKKDLEKEFLNQENDLELGLKIMQEKRNDVLKERYFATQVLKQGGLTPEEEAAVADTIAKSNKALRESVAKINAQRRKLSDLREKRFEENPDNPYSSNADDPLPKESLPCPASGGGAPGCSVPPRRPGPLDGDPNIRPGQGASQSSSSASGSSEGGFFNY